MSHNILMPYTILYHVCGAHDLLCASAFISMCAIISGYFFLLVVVFITISFQGFLFAGDNSWL